MAKLGSGWPCYAHEESSELCLTLESRRIMDERRLRWKANRTLGLYLADLMNIQADHNSNKRTWPLIRRWNTPRSRRMKFRIKRFFFVWTPQVVRCPESRGTKMADRWRAVSSTCPRDRSAASWPSANWAGPITASDTRAPRPTAASFRRSSPPSPSWWDVSYDIFFKKNIKLIEYQIKVQLRLAVS